MILPWKWRQYINRKLRLTFNELYNVISQTTELFIRQLVAIIIRSCIISVFYLTLMLKSSIFWDITQCSLLKVNWRFGEKFRLHLQRRKISETRDQPPALTHVSWLVHSSTLKMVECRLNFNGPHGVTSQKTELFITTGVRTSNPISPCFPLQIKQP
jgi:hypothetical protein